MYCTKCGNPNEDTAMFCKNCGNSLRSADPPPATVEPAQDAAEVRTKDDPEEKKGAAGKTWGFLKDLFNIVVGLGAIGIIVFLIRGCLTKFS